MQFVVFHETNNHFDFLLLVPFESHGNNDVSCSFSVSVHGQNCPRPCVCVYESK